jgi:hypothetical protein
MPMSRARFRPEDLKFDTVPACDAAGKGLEYEGWDWAVCCGDGYPGFQWGGLTGEGA